MGNHKAKPGGYSRTTSIFQLTPAEADIAPFVGKNLSIREIANRSGRSFRSVCALQPIILSKLELQKAIAKEEHKPPGATVLARARNSNSPTIDVRRGRWKEQ